MSFTFCVFSSQIAASNFVNTAVLKSRRSENYKNKTETELLYLDLCSTVILLSHLHSGYSVKDWEYVCETFTLSPSRWNVKHTLPQTLGDSLVCGGGTEMCNPGVWPLTHSSTTPLIHFSSPSHAKPFFKCVSKWWWWGREGIGCHFKKQLSGLAENVAWLYSV